MDSAEAFSFRTAIPVRQIVCIAALLGLLFRLEYLIQYSVFPNFPVAVGADVGEYYARAQNILRGLPFPVEPDIHAPLYSFFLAGICLLPGNGVVNARIIQLLLNFVAWFALYALLLRRKTPQKVALVFLVLAMFTPILCFHQAELISETLLLPLTAAALWSFEWAENRDRAQCFLLPGLCCAVGVLTHGLMLAYAAAEALWLLWKREFSRAAFFILALLLCLGSAILIKTAYYGKVTGIQANSAFNVWLGNNPKATGGCYLRPGPQWRKIHRNAAYEADLLKISVNALYWERIAFFWLDHPFKALGLTLKKGALVFTPEELISGADPPSLIYSIPLQRRLHWMTGEIMLLSLCGIFFAVRRKLKSHFHFYLLAGALFAAQIVTVTASRYRMGMMPALLLLAAIGAVSFPWKRWWFLPFAALLPFSFASEKEWEEKAAIWGEALLQQDKREEAETLLFLVRNKLKDPARIENLLGILAERRGSPAEAERHYRLAVKSEPEEPNGYFNLGKLCFNAPGKRAEAVRMLEKSIQLEPRQPIAWNDLGVAALQCGDVDRAAYCFAMAAELEPDHPGYQYNVNVCRQAAKEKKKK